MNFNEFIYKSSHSQTVLRHLLVVKLGLHVFLQVKGYWLVDIQANGYATLME